MSDPKVHALILKRACAIMDETYGGEWRGLPMLRSPEYAAAWQQAERESAILAATSPDEKGM